MCTAWYTQGPDIYDERTGQMVKLRGLNWFGFESDCKIVHGLWTRGLDSFFDFFVDYQYNAIRLPFGRDTIDQWDTSFPKWDCLNTENAWITGLSVKTCFHVFFQKAAEAGIVILLDFHSIADSVITPSPITSTFSENDFVYVWLMMLKEFGHYPNLLGIDLKNEPHGDYSWTDWGPFVARVVHRLVKEAPLLHNKLIFIEGVENTASVWGGSFQEMPRSNEWLEVWNSNQTVFSPHLYGVSVRGSVALQDTYTSFDRWFGFLSKYHNKCVVLGEIGGWFIDDDAVWHLHISNYLKKRNIRNIFYWALNPDSHDTGGLLYNNWWTVDTQKISFQEGLQPSPSEFTFTSSS